MGSFAKSLGFGLGLTIGLSLVYAFWVSRDFRVGVTVVVLIVIGAILALFSALLVLRVNRNTGGQVHPNTTYRIDARPQLPNVPSYYPGQIQPSLPSPQGGYSYPSYPDAVEVPPRPRMPSFSDYEEGDVLDDDFTPPVV